MKQILVTLLILSGALGPAWAGNADFDTTERIFTFSRSDLANWKRYRQAYGATLRQAPANPNSPEVRTLLACKDREDSDDLCPLPLEKGLSVAVLTNGRYAVKGCWSKAMLQAIREGTVPAQPITRAQLKSLYETDPDKQIKNIQRHNIQFAQPE